MIVWDCCDSMSGQGSAAGTLLSATDKKTNNQTEGAISAEKENMSDITYVSDNTNKHDL